MDTESILLLDRQKHLFNVKAWIMAKSTLLENSLWFGLIYIVSLSFFTVLAMMVRLSLSSL